MNALTGLNVDGIGVWVAFVLTLMVFSYVLGDNPFFRLAEHLFVGTAAGYAVVVAYHSILRPRLFEPLLAEPTVRWYLLLPLLLGVLLLAKGKRSTAWLGNTTMGFLFGVGAAVALGGALMGSLAPQVQATWMSLQPDDYAKGWNGALNALLVIVGTTGALLYFYYSAPTSRRLGKVWSGFRHAWGKAGHWFILVTLGAIFANTMVSRFSLLVGRLRFLLDTLGLLGG